MSEEQKTDKIALLPPIKADELRKMLPATPIVETPKITSEDTSNSNHSANTDILYEDLRSAETDIVKAGESHFSIMDYHKQGLLQANIAFTISILMTAVGFIVMLICVFLGINTESGVDWAGVVGSSVSSFTGATFYTVSSNARKSRDQNFKELNDIHRIESAIEIVERKIKSAKKREEKIILYTDELAGVKKDK
ncbi:MAG: hypothetical protein FWF79_00615 [Defluviitaleaceae bacterium]|nr:hypothetical protein [Defluviitaleaceae bacterium]